MMCGLLLADVMTDTMCVERGKLESDALRGSLQTLGYTSRSVGMILGSVLGTILYNKDTWGWGLTIAQIYLLNGLLPLIMIAPTYGPLVELSAGTELNIRNQLRDVWRTLQLRAVWRPIAFIYIYNVMQIPNSAWTNYLILGLDFTDFEIGILSISGAVM